MMNMIDVWLMDDRYTGFAPLRPPVEVRTVPRSQVSAKAGGWDFLEAQKAMESHGKPLDFRVKTCKIHENSTASCRFSMKINPVI